MPVQLKWSDGATIIAVVALVTIGALLVTDRVVPVELWAIVTFILGGHISLNGGGQVITAINGGAKQAFTHDMPGQAAPAVVPTVVVVPPPAPVQPIAPTQPPAGS